MPPITNTTTGYPNNYELVLNEFNSACDALNKSILQFYLAPKNFFKKAGPLLDKFVTRFPVKGKKTDKKSLKTVVKFMDELDEFTQKTIELYEDHMVYSAESGSYFERVKALSEKYKDNPALFTREFAQLTPEYIVLQNDLGQIREKAVEVSAMMKELDEKWKELSLKIK